MLSLAETGSQNSEPYSCLSDTACTAGAGTLPGGCQVGVPRVPRWVPRVPGCTTGTCMPPQYYRTMHASNSTNPKQSMHQIVLILNRACYIIFEIK